jgi:hypothetical protein
LVQSEKVASLELLEEVGGTAADLCFVGQFYTSNGISNEVAYVYLATGVELGKAQPEPTERSTELTPRADGDAPRARRGSPAHGSQR